MSFLVQIKQDASKLNTINHHNAHVALGKNEFDTPVLDKATNK